MRVCPKCGCVDHPAWKHVKYSYYIDSCSLENFKILHPTLSTKLLKPQDTAEDKHYYYRLCKNGRWVERKAKVDFNENHGVSRDLTERPKSPYQADVMFKKSHPDQRRLDEVVKP